MKTALVHAQNVYYVFKHDEWDSFRAEGRIPINIGFGLSLLDYDVNIVFHGWDIKNGPKKTWNNIKLSKIPIYDHYDLALSFGMFNPVSKFDKGINIVYENSHVSQTKRFIETTGIDIKYAYPLNWKHLMDGIKEHTKKDIYYIPPLYPIPSLNIGFLPCSYNPKLPELKVYLHYSSWPQNTTISGNRFTSKSQLVIDYLKSKGYNVKLSVLVENRGVQCPITSDSTTFFYSNESSYHDIINLILSSDICVTYGAPVFGGSSLNDIVSLGKPIIYIADGRINVEWRHQFTNLVYNYPNDLIYIQETDKDSTNKLEILMSNPLDLCRKRADMYKDCDFNTWKNIVKDIFS